MKNRFLFFKIILVKCSCKAVQESCLENWELGIAVEIKVLIYWRNKKNIVQKLNIVVSHFEIYK